MIPRLRDVLPLIHRRMGEMRLTQQDLGVFLRLDQTAISRRLSGKTQFKMEELALLLPHLGIAGQEDADMRFLQFPRLAASVHTLAPSSQKHVAMVLRAMAEDLEAVAFSEPPPWDGRERRMG